MLEEVEDRWLSVGITLEKIHRSNVVFTNSSLTNAWGRKDRALTTEPALKTSMVPCGVANGGGTRNDT